VVCVTSPGLLFRALQSRRGLDDAPTGVLDAVFPADRATPMVTVLDGHPHTLAFLTGVHRVRGAHLGVSRFGQSGDLDSVYRHHGLDADTIVGAALDLVD
jgi:pyruvate dehydrogenase E1 component